jgi:hypothetical protein
MMQKSITFTTIFRVKKCYFHYDFACKKVPLSLRYAKKYICSKNNVHIWTKLRDHRLRNLIMLLHICHLFVQLT